MMRGWRALASKLLIAAIAMTCCGGLAETAGAEPDDWLPEAVLDVSEMAGDAAIELDGDLIELPEADLNQPLELDVPDDIEIIEAPEAAVEAGNEAWITLGTDQAAMNAPENGFKLTRDAIRLGEGEQFDMMSIVAGATAETRAALKFKSSDRAVVRVSGDGLVTGRKKGSATITVTGPGGVRADCAVEVLDAPQSIRLSLKKPRLEYDSKSGIGESTSLVVKLPEDTASAIRYFGYDKSVVTVSETGTVTAVGLGETWITARTFNGMKACCIVRVLKPGERLRTGNIAHRGGAGYWPENTLEAFRNVSSTGATAIELDVQTTSDGVQVVHHNSTVKSGKKRYEISMYSYHRLKELKPSLCTLDEALKVISATKLDLFLEFKSTASPEKCLRAVKRYGMQNRTTYISFLVTKLRKTRALDKTARLGFLFDGPPANLDRLIYELKLDILCQKHTCLSQSKLARWQRQGLKVDVWTVDDRTSMDRYLKWGVDSITSNYPRLVTQAKKS